MNTPEHPSKWANQGACKGNNIHTKLQPTAQETAEALEICRACPVRVKCLEWALIKEPFHIWGGQTERQRALNGGVRTDTTLTAKQEKWLAAGGNNAPAVSDTHAGDAA